LGWYGDSAIRNHLFSGIIEITVKGGQIVKAKKARAFTLIEVLIDLFLLSLISAAIISGYMASVKAARFAKAKISAVALANEKMEEIRNMPYDNVATKKGIYPAGELEDSENINRGGIVFTLKRVVSYVDDQYDGNAEGTIPGQPVDLYPSDYKKVEIGVYLENKSGRLAFLTSNMAGKAAETPTETGIIKICVVDSKYLPVSEAIVTIVNPGVVPPVDLEVTTGNDGCILIPNLPPENHNQYHLSVTKNGFSTDTTYPRTPQNPNSTQPDKNVLIQQVTNQILVIDFFSTLTIDLVDPNGNKISDTVVHVEGTKEKWFNPSTFKYSADLTTDANGHLELKNMEFDEYKFTVPGKTIATISPYQPLQLGAGTTENVKITTAPGSDSMQIFSCTPKFSAQESLISLSITGSNLDSVTAMKIIQNESQFSGINLDYEKGSAEDSLAADFDLSLAPVGVYDLEIEKAGEILRQKDGFEIVQ